MDYVKWQVGISQRNQVHSETKMSATTFNATIFMNRAFEKAAKASATDFSLACIHALAEHYGFDAQEAVNRLGIDQVTVKKSATRKKGEGKVKVQKTKAEPKAKREVPEFPLPWTGSAVVGWCNGLRLNHGLHSQCCMEPIEGGEYCKTCQKQADKNASGKPTYGCVADRMACGLLEYRDPKAGKQTIPFANVMAKLSITREAAEAEATKFGLTIPEEHFVERAARRGRPKKDASASDSDSETSSTSSKQAKKRGRPKKEKKVIAASVGDDLIAQLVAQASTSNTVIASAEDDVSSISSAESESKPIKKVVKKVKKTTVESASDSSDSEADDKAAKKAAQAERKAKKEAKLQALTAEFQQLATQLESTGEVPTKLGELQKGITQMKKDLKAKQEAEELAKAQELAAAKELAQLQAQEITADSSEDEEEDDDEIEVKKFEFEGKQYLKSSDGVLYDPSTQEAVGVFNPDTNTIDEIEDFSDEEEDDE